MEAALAPAVCKEAALSPAGLQKDLEKRRRPALPSAGPQGASKKVFESGADLQCTLEGSAAFGEILKDDADLQCAQRGIADLHCAQKVNAAFDEISRNNAVFDETSKR